MQTLHQRHALSRECIVSLVREYMYEYRLPSNFFFLRPRSQSIRTPYMQTRVSRHVKRTMLVRQTVFLTRIFVLLLRP